MSEMTVGCIRTTVTPPPAGIMEALLEKAERERDQWKEESLEQARLLGKGSEREARLITERDHYKQALESLSSSTKKWANSHVPANQSLDFIKRISAYIEKQLNQ